MVENATLSRRSFLKATGGAASAGALTDTATGTDTATQQEAEDGGTLHLINATMTTLDPIQATDAASGIVVQQLFDGLMNYPNGEIEVEPQLATNIEQSDDFRTYTFTLKQGATFHNGEEVTAHDFVYAWERLAASDNSRRSHFILSAIGVQHDTDDQGNYQPGSLSVEAIDDYTLQVTLTAPFHATLEMLAYTAFAAIPEGLLGDIDGYDGTVAYQTFATRNPIGAGPFQFERWVPNDEVEVSRFAEYHGTVASLDAVHWRIIEDDVARYNYAMNKNAHAFNIPTPFYDPTKVTVEETDDLGREIGTYGPLRNGETVNYAAVATINSTYIGFNTDRVERPVRHAVAYVLNQQTVVEEVLKGRGQPAYHFTPPSIYPGGPDAYTHHATANYPYGYNETQLDNARQVMEEAGYGPDNRYEFTITIVPSQTWQQIAALLRDQLAQAHIEMQVESAPFSTLLQRGRNGELEAYSLSWFMDWPAPDNFLQLLNPPLTDTSRTAPLSYNNWSGTEAAQQAITAWEQIQSNPAPTEQAEQARTEAYLTVEEANWEDIVLLPVSHAISEGFWYDTVDLPKPGSAGGSHQMYNTTTLE